MTIESGASVVKLVRDVADIADHQWRKKGILASEIMKTGHDIHWLLNGVFLLDIPQQKKIYLQRIRKEMKSMSHNLNGSRDDLTKALVALCKGIDKKAYSVQQAWKKKPPKEWYLLCEEFIEAGKILEDVFE